MNKVIIGIVAIAIVLGVSLLWQKPENKEVPAVTKEKKLSVVATFYPLEEFARQVAGERATVTSIVPAGAEPHEYEPTPQDILKAYQANIFLLNGAGMDPWAEKIRSELEKRGVTVIQMADAVALLPHAHEEEEEHEDEANHEEGEGEEGEEHEESEFDPHFWVDPVLAEVEVKAISEALMERDKEGREVYARKRDAYIKELQGLNTAYKKGLGACRLKTVVTSHQAFAYMAKRYGFETISVSGISPEAEPSPRHLAEISNTVKKEGIKHIFFETLVSPKVAETLARETGAETLVFNPIEGLTDEERAEGENYLSLMRKNLENLKIALQCPVGQL